MKGNVTAVGTIVVIWIKEPQLDARREKVCDPQTANRNLIHDAH